ncbi:hypothetical protein H696_05063 [Fonticula alba]|uniref:Uncharacterized protein n=1 Tax=Fonticula alba TaxID=691883 RepID=A0A058Z5F3_FONAL|nr:hypothetical protein H696_05063 [Fonticula alba]KCV68767.1 hypothetical protein H696_05063 [Fonticula alba]|eukprot:XP_009497199.1 hypothetical protein H696_05063 [Fonticula alba]
MRCVAGCPVGHNTSAGGCSPCGSSCASCPLSAEECVQCERGKVLAGTMCVNSCPEGTLAQGGLCAGCAASCATCFGPARDQCLTCAPEWPLLLEGACLSSCPEGTAEDDELCVPCHETCAKCVGPARDECTSCPVPDILSGSLCVSVCPAGWYAPLDGGLNTCQACHPACSACSGPGDDQCTACPGEQLLEDHRCVDACSAGAFACLRKRQCDRCPPGCRECTLASETSDQCTSACVACEQGLLLLDGKCLAECPGGTFAAGQEAHCRPCASACATCMGEDDFCTSCPAGLYLMPLSGGCVVACPAIGFAPIQEPVNMCAACAAGCQRCAAGPRQAHAGAADGRMAASSEATICTLCQGHLLLDRDSGCVATCGDGFFADPEAAVPSCVPCPKHSIGLGVGLGMLLLLLILTGALLVVFLRRARRKPQSTEDTLNEDATMLNTMVELSLPGSIMVNIATDFAPLDDRPLGSGTQASVYAARAVGAGISDRLGCPEVVAIKQLKGPDVHGH